MWSIFHRLDGVDRLVLLIGLCAPFKIRIIGILSVSELLLLCLILLQRNVNFRDNDYVRRTMILSILWLVGIVISNIVNDVNQIDFLKGVFSQIIFIVIIPVIYQLVYEKPERLLLFIVGHGLSHLVNQYMFVNNDLDSLYSQDVYIYYSFNTFFCAIGFYLYFIGKEKIGALLCYSIAIIGLFNSARNPFLTGTIATIILFSVRYLKQYDIDTSVTLFKQKIPRYLMLIFLAAVLADVSYEHFASNGTLGEEAKAKYNMQKANGDNMLEGGRIETFMGMWAALKKPIFGYGSYAKDKKNMIYKQYYLEKHNKRVYSRRERYMPGHSYIIGSWVGNGILGLIFWIYILMVLFKIFTSGCIMCEPRLLCMLLFSTCALLWNICFSPLNNRIGTLFLIISLMVIYDNYLKGFYQKDIVSKLEI